MSEDPAAQGEIDVPVAIRRMVRVSPTDAVIAALADTQHGVVARRQLVALGLHPSRIQRRLSAGRLHVVHRGVYSVGHRLLAPEGRWLAAVLACGPGAVLSHRAAAAHHALRASAVVELTTPLARRAPAGVRVHTCRLAPDEIERRSGIPVTTVARTLFDLAAILPRHQLEAALNEAEYRLLASPTSVAELLARHPGRGAVALRHVLGLAAARTRTIGEQEFLAVLDAHDLPRPAMNVTRDLRGRPIEIDGIYAEAGLLVEIDGGSHKTERRFHEDRERDRAHLVAGLRTVRVSRLDDRLAADLRELIGHARTRVRRSRR